MNKGKFDWSNITRDDVIKAIKEFEKENSKFPSPRSTFLLYNGKKYPAKHIRGMAYKVAYGQEISKADFSGGMETAQFLKKRGFEIFHLTNTHEKSAIDEIEITDKKENHTDVSIVCEKLLESKIQESKQKNKVNLKIGLYLQTNNFKNQKDFNSAMKLVKSSAIDIIVFPEMCYTPFSRKISQMDVCLEDDCNTIYDLCIQLSDDIGYAIVYSGIDKYGTLFSIYANAFADESETKASLYIKHTMTDCSAFEINGYRDFAKNMFEPVIYKGIRIGMTICYDCNHSIFSRLYGLRNVDVILNSTGGDVVYDKWYKYNKVRAIENSCYNFVTMGGEGKEKNPHSFVYGFNPEGGELAYHNLVCENADNNCVGSVYVYDTSEDEGRASIETSIDQSPTINKNQHLNLPVGNVENLLVKSKRISEKLYQYSINGYNVIFCIVNDMDIMKPELILPHLYASELKNIKNKCYIIVNRFKYLDMEFLNTKLSLILKVRSMENFCAVILESELANMCYQCGNNRTAQIVLPIEGNFGIDLMRTSGPEAIWKNKQGMQASWRSNFEWLISIMNSDQNTLL